MTTVTWTKRDVSGSSSNLIAIACSSDATKYVTADQAGGASLWGSSNSGANWSAFSGVTGQWDNVVCSSNRQVILAIDASGNVSISTNGGSAWTTTAWTASMNLPYQVTMSGDGTKMLICTNVPGDYLYTSSDGVTWSAATGPGLQQWNSVSISRDGMTQAACWTDFATEGHILKTTNGWTTSSDVSPDTTIFWTYVVLGGTGAVAAALTTDGTSFYWTANGFSSWSSSTGTLTYASGSTEVAISSNGAVVLIATGSTGDVAWMSFNSGATWALQTLPGSDDVTRCYSACISADGTAGALADYPSDGTVWTFSAAIGPATRTIMLAWNEKDWCVLSQSKDLTYIGTQAIGTTFKAWGTDGTSLYPLFDTPSSSITKKLITKAYGADRSYVVKALRGVWMSASDLSTGATGISGTLEAIISGTPNFNASTGATVVNQTYSDWNNQPTFASPAPYFGTWGSAPRSDVAFTAISVKFSSTSLDFVLGNWVVGYTEEQAIF